jgi:uncharacterized protein YjbI with pentapeptide repeats
MRAYRARAVDPPCLSGYNNAMFTLTPCEAGCGAPAISGSRLCACHVADPEKEAARLGQHISKQRVVKDLCASSIHFESTDFSHRQYFGCNFNGASFDMCLFTGSFMRMVFFDFSRFENCDFSNCDLQFVSFAGCRMLNCTFENSELVHVNYGGAVIKGCTFNNSNLYNSRFISAGITDSDFVGCNLKKTHFFNITQERLSFKSSNTAEAIFDLEL